MSSMRYICDNMRQVGPGLDDPRWEDSMSVWTVVIATPSREEETIDLLLEEGCGIREAIGEALHASGLTGNESRVHIQAVKEVQRERTEVN